LTVCDRSGVKFVKSRMYTRYGHWITSNFKRLKLHKYKIFDVQKSLAVAFEFTGAARGFMITCMSCAARGVKRLGSTVDMLFLQ